MNSNKTPQLNIKPNYKELFFVSYEDFTPRQVLVRNTTNHRLEEAMTDINYVNTVVTREELEVLSAQAKDYLVTNLNVRFAVKVRRSDYKGLTIVREAILEATQDMESLEEMLEELNNEVMKSLAELGEEQLKVEITEDYMLDWEAQSKVDEIEASLCEECEEHVCICYEEYAELLNNYK